MSSEIKSKASTLKTGFTWRVLLVLVGTILIFVPLNIYSSFLTGTVQGSVAVFFITLLVVELIKMSGLSLSKQETLFLYYAAGWGGASLPVFYVLIYRSYFVHSPFAWAYEVNGKPLATLVPAWMAPPYNSPAYALRTVFQGAFLVPLLVYSISFTLSIIADVGISSFIAHILVEELNYPFPYAMIDTSMATFLAERELSTARYFIFSFMVGAIFGGLVYIPYILFGSRLIPVPFADATTWIQEILPGAVLAIPTTLSAYVGGMIMPFKAAIWMLISSIIVWDILNSLFVTTFRNFAPDWAREYIKGMGLVAIQNRSYLRLWIGPQLGFSVAIVLYVIFRIRKTLWSIFSAIFSKKSSDSLLLSPKASLLLFVTASSLGIVFYHFLVPEIPIWLPIFSSFIFSPFLGMASAVSQGEIGFGIPSSPHLWKSFVFLSTPSNFTLYQGFAFDLPAGGGSAPGFSQQVKASLMTEAHPKDLFKIWLIGAFLSQMVGLLAVDFFWRVAPIPSSAYPTTVYGFLGSAFVDSMFTTRIVNISFNTVIYPMLILLLVLFVGNYVESKGLFISCIGIIFGLFSTPNLGLFIGSLISAYLMPRFIGKETWDKVKGFVIAGEITGEGLAISIGIGLGILAKSAWIWPW